MRVQHTRLLLNTCHSTGKIFYPRATPLQCHEYWQHKSPASLSRALSTKASPTAANDSKDEGVFTALLSTIRHFNAGLSRLKSDFLISLHIRAANETRLHLDRKIRKDRELREQSDVEKKDECPQMANRRERWTKKHLSRNTNRRSARHIVQTGKDLQTTLPTVLGFLIPVAGYAFLILGVMFPKALLSRQFHTKDQRREFAMEGYGFRRDYFGGLAESFWGSFMTNPMFTSSMKQKPDVSADILTFDNMDVAGPVLNESSMLHLYDLCHKLSTDPSQNAFSKIPISHLQSMSLAWNLNSMLPLPAAISSELMFCFPRSILEARLANIAEDTIIDDVTLIQEGYLKDGGASLTGDEVMTACSARGLPVGRFAREVSSGENEEANMRTLLTNHLKMMQAVMMVRETVSVDGKRLLTGGVGISSMRTLVRDHALQFLVLHLPAIRYGGKSKVIRN